MKQLLLTTLAILSAFHANAQRTLGRIEVYTANKTTYVTPLYSDYKEKVAKGDILAYVVYDSNGAINGPKLIVEGNKITIEDDSPQENTFSFAKSDADVTSYTITPLTTAEVGKRMDFVSKDGEKARIFKFNKNGHRLEWCEISNYQYVLSVTGKYDNSNDYCIEDFLGTENGIFDLKGYFSLQSRPKNNINKSVYDEAGRLTANLICDFMTDPNIAGYIGSENALFFNNKLYYRVDNNSNTSASISAEPATTPVVPADLPLDEILKLIYEVSEPGPLLKAAGYKYVGEYSEGRSVIETWCRNCTCNKRGDVLGFQSGTSSVVCSYMGMGSPSTLLIEVFNTKARDAIIYKLEEMGFTKDNNQPPSATSYTHTTNDGETSCYMEKSKKGWLFSISPVVIGTE